MTRAIGAMLPCKTRSSVGADQGAEHDQDEELREAEEGVGQPHQQRVEQSAEVAGRRAQPACRWPGRSSVAASPMVSETRPPCSVRAKMSRPGLVGAEAVVGQDGPCLRSETESAFGSWVIDRGQHRGGDQDRQHDQPGHRQPVAQEAAHDQIEHRVVRGASAPSARGGPAGGWRRQFAARARAPRRRRRLVCARGLDGAHE